MGVVRVLLTAAGLLCYLAGGLWIVFFVALLFFGDIDWWSPVANGMSADGPVIAGIATLGVFLMAPGTALLRLATTRRRDRAVRHGR